MHPFATLGRRCNKEWRDRRESARDRAYSSPKENDSGLLAVCAHHLELQCPPIRGVGPEAQPRQLTNRGRPCKSFQSVVAAPSDATNPRHEAGLAVGDHPSLLPRPSSIRFPGARLEREQLTTKWKMPNEFRGESREYDHLPRGPIRTAGEPPEVEPRRPAVRVHRDLVLSGGLRGLF